MTQHIRLRFGDSFQILKSLESNSVRSFTTDPPYGLEFMNRDFDSFSQKWREFDDLPSTWFEMYDKEKKSD